VQTDGVTTPSDAIGRGLRRRLAELAAADERLRSFVFETGTPAPSPADDPVEALRDLALRALARAADPVNHALLRRLAGGDATVGELADLVGRPRVAVLERVNDLLQVGLVGRSLQTDAVGVTEAGQALVDLVEAVVRDAPA
jgi:predicted transcriptional regulator